MLIVTILLFTSIEAWQPTINTFLLILLALIGNGKWKRHRKATNMRDRMHDRRLRRAEDAATKAENAARRIEQSLDNSGPETDYLH